MCLTLVTPWTVACQVPLSMEFSKQESWSGLPFPSPGDLPDPGIKPRTPAMQADSLPTELPGDSQIYMFTRAILVHRTFIIKYQTNSPIIVLSKMKRVNLNYFEKMPRCMQHMLIQFSLMFENTLFKSYKRANVSMLLQKCLIDILDVWKISLLMFYFFFNKIQPVKNIHFTSDFSLFIFLSVTTMVRKEQGQCILK